MASKEISLTKGFVTIVDEADYDWLNQWKWCADTNRPNSVFYAHRCINMKKGKFLKIRMHRLIIDAKKGQQVDHINGDGLDNRRCNLRLCAHGQNKMNAQKRCKTSSKYKGVSWYKLTSKWMAHIALNKKKINLGYYLTEKEAATVYNDAAIRLHGEYARLNIL